MGEIELGELLIEWDDRKAAINYKKHGIHFEDAARIFLDDNRIDYLDELHSDDEERWKVIGKVRNILAVIYTERGENCIRLISARYATKDEEDEYYGQYPNL
ncbi:MAG: BrnT family toxin [Quinella sp. 1Q7]|nr:BrnT family toxin [Quinella sp. 1Q7]